MKDEFSAPDHSEHALGMVPADHVEHVRAMVVPEGYVLVPVEPTREMISAAGGAITTPDDLPPVGAGGWSMSDLAFRARYRAALAAAPTPEPVSPWISVEERLPEPNTQVLAFYVNSHGKGRRIRAEYIAEKSREVDADYADPDTQCVEYDEAADTYYLTAGWYELIDNWDEYTSIKVVEGEVTLWTPLPAAPEQPAKEQGHE